MPGKTVIPCPHCHKRIAVPDSRLGGWITCPGCRLGFAALREEPAPADPIASLAEEESLPRSRPPILGIAFGVILGVVVLFVVVYAIAVNYRAVPAQPAEPGRTPVASPTDQLPRDILSREGLPLDSLDDVVRKMQKTHEEWQAKKWIYLCTGLGYGVALILILAWVARDSRARGVEGSATWASLIFFTGGVALLVYLAARPRGSLVACPTCSNKRLSYSRLCPHCGNA